MTRPAASTAPGEAQAPAPVSGRLSHPGPPAQDGQPGRVWPLRASDFDLAGHVNNSVHWAAVEDVLAGAVWLPTTAEIQYRRSILVGHDPRLVACPTVIISGAGCWTALSGWPLLASPPDWLNAPSKTWSPPARGGQRCLA